MLALHCDDVIRIFSYPLPYLYFMLFYIWFTWFEKIYYHLGQIYDDVRRITCNFNIHNHQNNGTNCLCQYSSYSFHHSSVSFYTFHQCSTITAPFLKMFWSDIHKKAFEHHNALTCSPPQNVYYHYSMNFQNVLILYPQERTNIMQCCYFVI